MRLVSGITGRHGNPVNGPVSSTAWVIRSQISSTLRQTRTDYWGAGSSAVCRWPRARRLLMRPKLDTCLSLGTRGSHVRA